MSLVTVMMWQPTLSAWTTFRISRGEARSARLWRIGQDVDRFGHQRHRIDARVGDASGKNRNDEGAPSLTPPRSARPGQREHRRHVTLTPYSESSRTSGAIDPRRGRDRIFT